MTDIGIEGKVIEKIGDEVIKKASPLRRLWETIKKIVFSLMIIKWFISFLVAWFNMIRQALLLSLTDKYQEDKVWKAVLWIKTWRLIYGIIIGLVLAYFYAADDHFMEFIYWIIDLFNG